MTRRQPRSASSRASARPSPREAPVMIAVGMRPTVGGRRPRHHRELVLGPPLQNLAAGPEGRGVDHSRARGGLVTARGAGGGYPPRPPRPPPPPEGAGGGALPEAPAHPPHGRPGAGPGA